MKIGISSTGPSLNNQIDARFGRCDYFMIVDSETMAKQAIPNENVSATSGAGISAAQLMADKGVDIVLTGNVGPKAANVFDAAGIRVLTGMSGTVGGRSQTICRRRGCYPTGLIRPDASGSQCRCSRPGFWHGRRAWHGWRARYGRRASEWRQWKRPGHGARPLYGRGGAVCAADDSSGSESLQGRTIVGSKE
jgi:predicted Fe-Mo cluster-binding NifX family protein